MAGGFACLPLDVGKSLASMYRAQVLNAVQSSPGAPFEEEKLKAAEENIKNLLISNGFYESKIQREPRKEEDTQQIDVRVQVDPGKRARYDTPGIHGDTKLSDA